MKPSNEAVRAAIDVLITEIDDFEEHNDKMLSIKELQRRSRLLAVAEWLRSELEIEIEIEDNEGETA